MTIHVTLAGVCEIFAGAIVAVSVIKILWFLWMLLRWNKG